MCVISLDIQYKFDYHLDGRYPGKTIYLQTDHCLCIRGPEVSTNQAYLQCFVKIGPHFVDSAVIRGNDYEKNEVLSIISTTI